MNNLLINVTINKRIITICLKHGRKGYQKREPSHFLIGAGIQERLFSQQWDIVLRTNINTL